MLRGFLPVFIGDGIGKYYYSLSGIEFHKFFFILSDKFKSAHSGKIQVDEQEIRTSIIFSALLKVMKRFIHIHSYFDIVNPHKSEYQSIQLIAYRIIIKYEYFWHNLSVCCFEPGRSGKPDTEKKQI